MFDHPDGSPAFDPDFDDTAWTDEWLHIPVVPVTPGTYPGGYRVEARTATQAEIFGQMYHVVPPLDCRLLFDPDDNLWMSDTPQERIMMHNNARRSGGHVLVGGLGLGLYPQYAVTGVVGRAERFTCVEISATVQAVVAPVLHAALPVPLDVVIEDVGDFLAGPVRARYDTIFLDVWHQLDAALLPPINHLRDRALRHLAPGGEVLLWGYGWMLRLFEAACIELLNVPPAQRETWLSGHAESSPEGVDLLWPVLEYCAAHPGLDRDEVLAWCRGHIITRTH